MSEKMTVLALDAMGVIYRSGDDVGELLIPFIKEHKGTRDISLIEDLYQRASLGEMTSDKFWHEVGVSPELEDNYLERHELVEGLLPFLDKVSHASVKIICLSNDVAEWSLKLRQRFGLERYIATWFVSGEMSVRKPNSVIYQAMLKTLNEPAKNITFVDDREKNVAAANELGIGSILFRSDATSSVGAEVISDYLALSSYLKL